MQTVATGVIHSYVGSDHKVIDMPKLADGIIQAQKDAYQSGISDVGRLPKLLEQTCKDITRLDRQVATLIGRIEPFDDEKAREPRRWTYDPEVSKPRSVAAMADTIGEMLYRLDNMERDFAALRAKIEAAESGGYLREELAPYMKPRSPRGR
jgi:hypothetical protein